MELNLTNEQLDELFSSDPQANSSISDEELESWFMQAGEVDLNDLNPYREL